MILKFIKTTDAEYAKERQLRVDVLRKPLGMPAGTEEFPFEKGSLHLVAIDGDKVVGCALFHREGDIGRLFQMAVDNKLQRKGIGSALIKEMSKKLKEDGVKEIHLHARNEAIPFYEKLGFKTDSEEFIEIGIKHHIMRKKL